MNRILLGGTSALALLASFSAHAACTGAAMATGDACTVATTGGDINQSVTGPVTTATPSTAVSQIAPTGAATSLTVASGAGIVNQGGTAILATNGSIATIGNQGTIGSATGNSATILVVGNVNTTINNATTASGATIANTTGVAIMTGNFGGSTTSGALTVTQGSATTSGTISSGSGNSAAIYVGRSSGNVTINNVNGTIQGQTALDLTTTGTITVTNGDGTRVGQIIGTGNDTAVLIGTNNMSENQSPTFALTNNAGSLIKANVAGQNAIQVDHALGGASTIVNHGTITAGAGAAAIDLTRNSSGTNRVTVTNDGTITGDIKLGSGDTLNMNGGTITGNVTATNSSSSIAVGGDATLNGTIGTSAIWVPVSFGGDHTLTVAAGKSIWGHVTAGTDGEGTVAFNGASNVYADMGRAGAGLKALAINGGTVDVDNNNFYVGQTTVNSGGTLALCAANGCSSGNTLHGDLRLNGGTLDLTRGGGVTTLAAGPNGAAGAFATTSGSTIKTAISGDGTTSGAGNTSNITRIVAGGAANLATGTNVNITTGNALTISNGARYLLVDGTGAATVGTVAATSGTPMLTWSVLRGDHASLGQDSSDVYLVANKRELSTLVRSPGATGTANALTRVAASNDTAVQALVSAISNISAQDEVDKAVKQLSPNTSLGAATTSGSTAATSANITTVNARAADIRTAQAGGMTGVATGDSLRGLGVWAQAMGHNGRQDTRKGQDGYASATAGLAVGADVQVATPVRVGAAFSYAQTSVESKDGSTGSGVDIDSTQGTLYANYTGTPWYVDAALVYGRHSYDSARAISFPGYSAVARGEYAGSQYSAQLGAGYPLVVANTLITPNASLAYSLLEQDAYTETGAPGANLSVDAQSNTSLRSGLGVKAAKSFSDGSTRLVPELRATWYHEFRGSAPEQTARFSAGGSSFTTTGARPAKDSVALGLGLTVARADQVSLSANYDAEFKEEYVGHNGTLQLRVEF